MGGILLTGRGYSHTWDRLHDTVNIRTRVCGDGLVYSVYYEELVEPYDTTCGTVELLCRDVTYVAPYSGEDRKLSHRIKMLGIPRVSVLHKAGSISLRIETLKTDIPYPQATKNHN